MQKCLVCNGSYDILLVRQPELAYVILDDLVIRFIFSSASLMFLWQMKFQKTQTPWSMLTLSRKKTNVPSRLMLKISEENISRYQFSPIIKNNLNSLFHSFYSWFDCFLSTSDTVGPLWYISEKSCSHIPQCSWRNDI